jgi:monoamine oxidase
LGGAVRCQAPVRRIKQDAEGAEVVADTVSVRVKYSTVSAAERRKVFRDGLVRRFGPKAATPTYFDDFDWAAELWSRGDMFAHYAPGVLTGFGQALREPCGRIHWAGTEIAGVWSGSSEGAIRSGERAADEVLKR